MVVEQTYDFSEDGKDSIEELEEFHLELRQDKKNFSLCEIDGSYADEYSLLYDKIPGSIVLLFHLRSRRNFDT